MLDMLFAIHGGVIQFNCLDSICRRFIACDVSWISKFESEIVLTRISSLTCLEKCVGSYNNSSKLHK